MKDIENRLDFTINKSEKILKHFNRNSNDNVYSFCFYMIERLNYSSRGLVSLLKDIPSQPDLEYSCGIIMRTVLLDFMIVLNGHVLISENLENRDRLKEELDDFCSTMLFDSVNHTLSDVEKLRISMDARKAIYKGLTEMYSDYLEPYADDGTKPIPRFKKSHSNGRLFEKIFNSKDLRKYANIYQAYLFYSKYDHFGKMYSDIASTDFKKRLSWMNESIKAFPRMLMFILAILIINNHDDQFLIEEFNLTVKYNDSY